MFPTVRPPPSGPHTKSIFDLFFMGRISGTLSFVFCLATFRQGAVEAAVSRWHPQSCFFGSSFERLSWSLIVNEEVRGCESKGWCHAAGNSEQASYWSGNITHILVKHQVKATDESQAQTCFTVPVVAHYQRRRIFCSCVCGLCFLTQTCVLFIKGPPGCTQCWLSHCLPGAPFPSQDFRSI